jgi:hypothetical protein
MPGLLWGGGIRGSEVCCCLLLPLAISDGRQPIPRQEDDRMREFSKISPAVWHSSRFNGLPSQDGRYLYLYLLTSPHQTSAGAYSLPEGYACADLQWPKEKYCVARTELIAADLVDFDAESEVVLIKRWFKHNPPMNQKHLQGILKQLERLPSARLQETALADVQEVLKARESTQSRPPTNGAASGRVLNTSYLNGR